VPSSNRRPSPLALAVLVVLATGGVRMAESGPRASGSPEISSARPAASASSPVVLFSGRNLEGWRQPTGPWQVVKAVALNAADPTKLVTTAGAGVAWNGNAAGPGTPNLVTEGEYGDVELHVEFLVPRGSNSGLYLMGRYEVQVFDSFGRASDAYPGAECGGIYPRWIGERNVEGHSPRVNASRPPGEWQSYDITFRAPRFDGAGRKTASARFVKVVHNGQVVHEGIDVSGPTRAAIFDDEKPAGPLMLQGDHGPVAYRNLRLRKLARE
jgi:hypothetical protein